MPVPKTIDFNVNGDNGGPTSSTPINLIPGTDVKYKNDNAPDAFNDNGRFREGVAPYTRNVKGEVNYGPNEMDGRSPEDRTRYQRLADSLNNRNYYKGGVLRIGVNEQGSTFDYDRGGHYQFNPIETEEMRNQAMRRQNYGKTFDFTSDAYKQAMSHQMSLWQKNLGAEYDEKRAQWQLDWMTNFMKWAMKKEPAMVGMYYNMLMRGELGIKQWNEMIDVAAMFYQNNGDPDGANNLRRYYKIYQGNDVASDKSTGENLPNTGAPQPVANPNKQGTK